VHPVGPVAPVGPVPPITPLPPPPVGTKQSHGSWTKSHSLHVPSSILSPPHPGHGA
jgi:hypothetical protein